MKIEVEYPNSETSVIINDLNDKEVVETETSSTTMPEISISETQENISEPKEEITSVKTTGPRAAPIENNKGAGWFSGTSWG